MPVRIEGSWPCVYLSREGSEGLSRLTQDTTEGWVLDFLSLLSVDETDFVWIPRIVPGPHGSIWLIDYHEDFLDVLYRKCIAGH